MSGPAHTPDDRPDANGAASPHVAGDLRTPLRLAHSPHASRARARASVLARRVHTALVFAISVIVVWALEPLAGSAAAMVNSAGAPTAAATAWRLGGALITAALMLVAARRQGRVIGFARLSGLAQGVYRVQAMVAGIALLASIAFFVPQFGLGPVHVLVAGLSVALTGALWSLTTRQVLGARPLTRVLIVGDGDAVHRLASEFAADPHPEYELVGMLGSGAVAAPELSLLGSVAELEKVLAAKQIDHVVVASGEGRLELFARLAAWPGPLTVQELPAFSEDIFGRVPVDVINAAWFMRLIHPHQRAYSRAMKRFADISLSTIIGLLALPLLPFVALAVRLSGPGPILYRQIRCGEHGEEFPILKFRTMVNDAERNGAQWAQTDDPRVTKAGRFMRATRLDELPQLYNILRGNMSFVGPRPERPEFVAELEQAVPYYQRRHMVKPGLTGWAQVRLGYADSVDGAADKLGYELYYLKHHSLLMDIVIFVETVRVVMFRFGAR